MSGQLVGEVIAAADTIKAGGVSERGFHALIAIAEKCHYESRQGSVPWIWIRRGLYGASKRTAERAVGELRQAKLVTVVARGFKNQHLIRSPIYEMAVLDTDTALSVPTVLDTDTALSVPTPPGTDKTGSRYRQTESRYRHLGVVLNGSNNGPINGGGRESSSTTTPPPPKILEEEEPPRDCLRHPGGTRDRCGDCADTRRAHQRWHAERDKREHQAAADRRHAIDICGLCNEVGQRLAANGLDAETPTRCDHTAEAAR